MRNDYRTFVVEPPSLLQEQPQLIDQVVREALENTVARGDDAPKVESVSTRRLEDGRLRVAASFSRGPRARANSGGRALARVGMANAAAFRHNIDAAARAVERDGISYSFLGVAAPRAVIDNPERREVAVMGAIERTFPELAGPRMGDLRSFQHDLYCVGGSGATPHYVLDVGLTADPRSGLDGRDGDVRQASFDRHLGDLARALAGGVGEGEAGEEGGGAVPDEDEGARLLVPLTVQISRDRAQQARESGRDDELVAAALERAFPELRDREYGFDYELGEDLLRINLSAQPQGLAAGGGMGEAWEVSLAASPSEREAAVEANLEDVVRETCDGVERSSSLSR